jgi:hypothetical protein
VRSFNFILLGILLEARLGCQDVYNIAGAEHFILKLEACNVSWRGLYSFIVPDRVQQHFSLPVSWLLVAVEFGFFGNIFLLNMLLGLGQFLFLLCVSLLLHEYFLPVVVARIAVWAHDGWSLNSARLGPRSAPLYLVDVDCKIGRFLLVKGQRAAVSYGRRFAGKALHDCGLVVAV